MFVMNDVGRKKVARKNINDGKRRTRKSARLATVGKRHIVRLISGNFITAKLLVPGKYMRKTWRHLKFALPTIHTAGVYLIES